MNFHPHSEKAFFCPIFKLKHFLNMSLDLGYSIVNKSWYKTIRLRSENGKIDRPYFEAMVVLANIVGTINELKVAELQINYNAMSDHFGVSYKVIREIVKYLESIKVVRLDLRNLKVEGVGTLQNVMFISIDKTVLSKL